MAKLSISYTLCPLIDQKSLMGVSQDSKNNHVIVTLGKNMVVRYKVKDQKQISSWSTTLKFTSQVIFDGKSQKYASVLDQNLVRLWEERDQTLDEVKKYKFGKEIHCLLPQSELEPSLVVFRDGTFGPLSEALENRKAQGEKKHLAIQDCKIVTDQSRKYIIYLTVTPAETCFHAVTIDSGEETTFPLSRDTLALRGHAVVEEEGKCVLYTLWSDGKLFAMHLFSSDSTPPGIFFHTMSEINFKHGVAMTPLSGSHLAIYGADVSEEGAILLIFNTQFCFVQARQLSKLFGIAPRLWKIGMNLFLASGNFLMVVPYKLDIAKLAAVVGSHAPDAEKITRAVWGETFDKPAEIDAPPSIARNLKTLATVGWPQATIAAKLLPKLIKEKDFEAIIWVLKNYEDIQEDCIITLLDYCLSQDDAVFKGLEADTEVDDTNPPNASRGKRAFLDAILSCPFADITLLPHLRSLSFPNTLALLAHLSEKLTTSDDANAVDWMNLALDSHYQEFLLCKDPLVLTTLVAVRNSVEEEVQDTNNLKALEPLVHRLSLNKSIVQKQNVSSDYSICDATFEW